MAERLFGFRVEDNVTGLAITTEKTITIESAVPLDIVGIGRATSNAQTTTHTLNSASNTSSLPATLDAGLYFVFVHANKVSALTINSMTFGGTTPSTIGSAGSGNVQGKTYLVDHPGGGTNDIVVELDTSGYVTVALARIDGSTGVVIDSDAAYSADNSGSTFVDVSIDTLAGDKVVTARASVAPTGSQQNIGDSVVYTSQNGYAIGLYEYDAVGGTENFTVSNSNGSGKLMALPAVFRA